MAQDITQDPRFLAGLELFNRHDFFAAHEAWEELWMVTSGKEKSFVQGLIQWALALYHFANGNLRGARSLFDSGAELMKGCGRCCQGFDIQDLERQMVLCLEELLRHTRDQLAGKEDETGLIRFPLNPEKLPKIR